jgi:hypothetical protein
VAGGRAEHLEERFAAAAGDPGLCGERPVDLAADGLVASRGGDRSGIDERPEWRACRVLAGEIEQDERFEGLRPIRIATEFVGHSIEDVVDGEAADPLVERVEGRGKGAGPDVALVAIDEGMGDLMEQAEGDDLAGVGRRFAATPLVQPTGQPPGRSNVVDVQLALLTEVAMIEVIPSP